MTATRPPADERGWPLEVDVVVRRGAFQLDVAISVAPGEVLGVLGPNGAGKTTLLRALAGLAAATEGSIRLGDAVLDDAATGTFVPAEQRPVGLVFQNYRLFPHLSVRDNVAFAARSRGSRTRRGAPARRSVPPPARPRRARRPQAGAALRRPGAARRARPGAGRRPGDAAARRAAVRARRPHPPRGARRAAPSPRRLCRPGPARDPRPARGDGHDRPARRDRGRQGRAAGRARSGRPPARDAVRRPAARTQPLPRASSRPRTEPSSWQPEARWSRHLRAQPRW